MAIKDKRALAFSTLFMTFVASFSLFAFYISPKTVKASDNGDCTNSIPVPSSYTASSSARGEGWSSVVTKVKRNDEGFNDLVYAKPGDRVVYTHCYYPGAQRVANLRVTNKSYLGRPSTISGPNANVFPYVYTTIGNLTAAESSSHVRVWTINDGHPEGHYPNQPAEFDDGPYSTIANFSRVTNLYGYYGGLNIFNTPPYSNSGYDTPMGEGNGFGVGGDRINKVGKYTETQKMLAPNHARVWEGSDQKTWSCSYVTNENPYTTDSCKHFDHYEKKTIPAHCSKDTSGIVLPGGAPPQAYCAAAGGSWIKAEEVDDTTKPVYKYDNPCRVTHTTTCSRGTGENSKYIDYLMNTDNNGGNAPTYTEASVIVPYNYELEPSIDIQNPVVYAGETATLQNAKANVKTRYNSVTNGDYATDVPYVELKVTTYIATDANGNNEVSGTRNERSKVYNSGSTALYPSNWEYSFDVGTVSVHDTNAGNYFCAKMTVYPTNSGDFTNYSDQQGNHSSGTSGAVCRIIAKRPTFQVWGGGIFSSGAIDVSRNVKNNLQGNSERPYKVAVPSDGNVFGSWAELGVTALGKNGGSSNKGMASASATAGMWGRYESTTSTGLCRYESMLSFANFSKSAALAFCNGATNLNANGYFGLGAPAMSKNTLIDDIWDYTENPIADGDVLNFIVGAPSTYKEYMNANGKLVRYSYVSGNIGISSGTANPMKVEQGFTGEGKKSTTYIVRSDKNVKIYNNIEYPDTYQTLNDIPKVVVYAKGNIDIWCGVTRIDAILIAEGTINTCNDDGNASVSRNVQLKINGALIADRLLLNRTYGAGPGAASGVPAEIINYDTSMLLWGQSQADISASGKMNATYTRELAPRY